MRDKKVEHDFSKLKDAFKKLRRNFKKLKTKSKKNIEHQRNIIATIEDLYEHHERNQITVEQVEKAVTRVL